jgi:hypothetical protein
VKAPFGPPLKVSRSAIYDGDIPEYIPRDHHGRPLIMQPDGTLVPYARASVVSKAADDGHGLHKWNLRHTALSIARYPDVTMRIAALEYGDKELDTIITEAQERSVAMLEKRHYGTAIHSFTEMDMNDYRRDFAGALAVDVRSYDEALAESGLVRLEQEVFVVNDDLGVAGKLDNLYRDTATGFIVVGDSKTGSVKPFSVSAQLGFYVSGQRYDPITGERTPLHPDLDMENVALVHIPAGAGATEIHRLSGSQALADARLCAALYRRRMVRYAKTVW